MSFDLIPGVRYDMPAAFGPSIAPDLSSGYEVLSATVLYTTDHDAMAALLPRWFAPTSRPVVSVNYQRLLGLDWMGGRNYNIVSVYVTSRTQGEGVTGVEAPYGLVIWENDCAPIISGREYMGTPKLYGEIPDTEVLATEVRATCSEYGTPLLDIEMSNMRRVSDDVTLERMRRAGDDVCRVHWKYIPGLNGTPDADYPVAMYSSHTLVEAWTGDGQVTYHAPEAKAAPYSGRITEVLRRLPVVEERGAVSVHLRDVQLRRSRTTRLDTPGES